LSLLYEFEPKSWEELLNIASRLIIEQEIENRFPQIVEESERRWDQFDPQ